MTLTNAQQNLIKRLRSHMHACAMFKLLVSVACECIWKLFGSKLEEPEMSISELGAISSISWVQGTASVSLIFVKTCSICPDQVINVINSEYTEQE